MCADLGDQSCLPWALGRPAALRPRGCQLCLVELPPHSGKRGTNEVTPAPRILLSILQHFPVYESTATTEREDAFSGPVTAGPWSPSTDLETLWRPRTCSGTQGPPSLLTRHGRGGSPCRSSFCSYGKEKHVPGPRVGRMRQDGGWEQLGAVLITGEENGEVDGTAVRAGA